MLYHPTEKLVNTNVLDMKDAQGKRLFADMIVLVKKEGASIYDYYWKDTDGITKPKISYVQGVPEWKWLVGSGLYVDSIEKTVREAQKSLGIPQRLRRGAVVFRGTVKTV